MEKKYADAKKQLDVIQIKQMNEEAAANRRRIAFETEARLKAEGKIISY